MVKGTGSVEKSLNKLIDTVCPTNNVVFKTLRGVAWDWTALFVTTLELFCEAPGKGMALVDEVLSGNAVIVNLRGICVSPLFPSGAGKIIAIPCKLLLSSNSTCPFFTTAEAL